MNAKMLGFHIMNGSQANAAPYMKIMLRLSMDKFGHEYYSWELWNIYTGHRWYTAISKKAYTHLSNRLAKNYRFRSLPMKQYDASSCMVFENQYYI